MDCLTLPPSMPEYRSGRPHDSFLTRLKDHLPHKGSLAAAVPVALRDSFHVVDASWEELQTAAAAPARGKRISTHYVDLGGWTQEGPPPGVSMRGNSLPRPSER
jgi:hypothetical protein